MGGGAKRQPCAMETPPTSPFQARFSIDDNLFRYQMQEGGDGNPPVCVPQKSSQSEHFFAPPPPFGAAAASSQMKVMDKAEPTTSGAAVCRPFLGSRAPFLSGSSFFSSSSLNFKNRWRAKKPPSSFLLACCSSRGPVFSCVTTNL